MAEGIKRALTLLRRKQVQERTGVPSSTMYDKMNPKSPRYDPTFPTQIRLSASAVGWVESEVEEWIEARIRATRTAPAN